MLSSIDWRQAVHDPRFWAIRYECDGTFRKFPGVTRKESASYYQELLEDEQGLEQDGTGEKEEGWTLTLTFPEEYTWQMNYTTEDEMDSGTDHFLHHPTIYSTGIFLAAEGPDDHLPGLRWAELKQIATCLTRHWQGDFDGRAIIPLLYPVVQYITFDEVEDVYETLATAWQDLQALDTAHADQWLSQIMRVYEKGQLMRCNAQKEWELAFQNPQAKKEDLWVQREGEGWKTTRPTSTRYFQRDSHQFLPFFSMLEQYA